MSSSSLVTGALPLGCIGSPQPGHRTTGKVADASLPILRGPYRRRNRTPMNYVYRLRISDLRRQLAGAPRRIAKRRIDKAARGNTGGLSAPLYDPRPSFG